jgi:phosphoribosyl 1,2-cyclic phosphodiesterase
MIVLAAGTTHKLQLVTSAAVTVDVQASGVDWTVATTLSSAWDQNTAITTATTTDIVAAPGAGVERTVKGLKWRMLRAGDRKRIAGFSVRTGPLFHYSGEGRSYRVLDAIGFRLTTPDGASIAYLCDHEPRPGTAAAERALVEGVQLAVYDAHFPNVRDHMHGHGSQEHAARMARDYPGALVLAGHHGPAFSDRQIKVAYRRHRKGTPNFELAVEGDTYRFDRRRGSFVRRKSAGL